MADFFNKFFDKKLTLYLIANRFALLIGTYFLVIASPIQKILPFKSFLDFLLTFGRRWDGNSYTFIATHGYVLTGPEKNFLVFPPFYPFLIKALAIFHIDIVLSAIIVSNLFFILGMLVFYQLLSLDYAKKFSFYVIILISIFPTSYFFSVAYPESLFVFLFAVSFYLTKKRSYFLAGIFGGLSAITRPFGIVLAPALFVQLLINKDLNLKNFLTLYLPFAVPSFYYLFINYTLFSNPFEFLIFLKENWQKSFDYPWKGIIASWNRGIVTTDNFTYKYFVGFGEGVASTFAWLSILLGLRKWGIKSSYLTYLILGTIFFTSTSFILSAPRYLLSIPPFFILLAGAMGSNKFMKIIWITLSVFLLFYISQEFAWGHWTF